MILGIVQKWNGAWNKLQLKKTLKLHMSGWHNWISIRFLNWWRSVLCVQFPLQANIFYNVYLILSWKTEMLKLVGCQHLKDNHLIKISRSKEFHFGGLYAK